MFGGIDAMIENSDEVWDYTRPNPSYFEHIENTTYALALWGIQADLILFHPYDRWGYSCMNLEQQNFYLRYVVNRFSAYHNVWWAMANEFDLCPAGNRYPSGSPMQKPSAVRIRNAICAPFTTV